jgi:hypothetical protein
MLVAIGPGQICVSNNNERQTTNKDFPRGQVNGFADNLDFEKIKTGDRLKLKQPTLRIFKKIVLRIAPAHLAHAIAAQTHLDTKAMARAKSPV